MKQTKLKPTVFISSTCNDLKEIRENLKNYIAENLGLIPLLSEYDSFPVDPLIGNAENCFRNVNDVADIFILIIGKRYGYLMPNGKSITHMEYIHARNKGIPIYVFIDNSLMNILSKWNQNGEMDIKEEVDNSKLLTFVNALFDIEDIWVHKYDTVEDIKSTLNNQIPYLFNDCLNIKRKLSSTNTSNKLLSLGETALEIVLGEDVLWEYRLFNFVVENGFKLQEDLKRDLKYGFTFEKRLELTDPVEIITWISQKNIELLAVSEMLDILFNNSLQEALGEPGEKGDVDYIIYVAEKVVSIYKSIIEWGLNFNSVLFDTEWKNLIGCLSDICNTLITDLDQFIQSSIKEIRKCELFLQNGNPEQCTFEIKLTLSTPDFTIFYEELEKIKINHGIIS